MNSVGDRLHVIGGKLVLGDLRMAPGYAIHIAAQIQSELSHIACIGACVVPQLLKLDEIAKNAGHHLIRKTVVRGLHWRMGRKDAALQDRFLFVERPRSFRGREGATKSPQQFKRKKRRMTFIHVIGAYFETERPQNSYTADSKDSLLTKAIFFVSAVKSVCDATVFGIVLFEIGVEQDYGNARA